MLALEATSDELRKYPMVTDNLVPFAGPQCYPHLDKSSAEYRVNMGKLKTESPEDHVDGAHEGSVGCPTVLQDGSWVAWARCGL